MRLFWKIYLVSLGSVLFCTVLLTGIVSYREAENSMSRLRNEQRLLAVTAASQVESGYFDQIWPFEMLSAIAKEPDFVSWQIVDGSGRPVLSDRPAAAPFQAVLDAAHPSSLAPERVTIPASSVEFWVVPLRMRTERSSWVFRLGFHTDSVRAQIRQIVLTNALAGLAIAVLFVGISLVLTQKLLAPLNSLTGAATQMERGNLDVSLPRAGGDEIGQLVSGFRAMVASIKERDTKIQEQLESLERARDELESRVEARTRELQRAKAAAEAAAASLRDSEERTRAIIQYAADAIITMDDLGRIEIYNPAAERLFGYAADEIRGQPASALFPEGYSIDLDALSIRATEGASRVSLGDACEILGRRKDGATCPIQVALSAAQLGDKRLTMAIVRDISERKRAESEHLELNQRLVSASRVAGMAEVAAGVLHNVGNVLTSVNVSATVVADTLSRSRISALAKAVALLREHEGDLGAFLTEDPRGKLVPAYLDKLSATLAEEQATVLSELASLTKDIDHIKRIVQMQQSYAKLSVNVREAVSLPELMEDALRITAEGLERHHVQVIREYAATPPVTLDRHKILHILVNLINNAKRAVAACGDGQREIRLRTGIDGGERVRFEVADSGVGIPAENLPKLFNHGFTTSKDGHGFGLHSGALSAKEMGGVLTVRSEGVGRGAVFSLLLPLDAARGEASAQALSAGRGDRAADRLAARY
ncbi:PAS domain S-box protein [Sorangium sp. So ce136]|uniref:sensor histidine kinase n=1 Tax=Sorangium sp. So ce136 TaxID=3133284 RepID=UPI003F07E9DE